VDHRNQLCFALRGLRCLRLNVRLALQLSVSKVMDLVHFLNRGCFKTLRGGGIYGEDTYMESVQITIVSSTVAKIKRRRRKKKSKF
jgi:hypothetical protein